MKNCIFSVIVALLALPTFIIPAASAGPPATFDYLNINSSLVGDERNFLRIVSDTNVDVDFLWGESFMSAPSTYQETDSGQLRQQSITLAAYRTIGQNSSPALGYWYENHHENSSTDVQSTTISPPSSMQLVDQTKLLKSIASAPNSIDLAHSARILNIAIIAHNSDPSGNTLQNITLTLHIPKVIPKNSTKVATASLTSTTGDSISSEVALYGGKHDSKLSPLIRHKNPVAATLGSIGNRFAEDIPFEVAETDSEYIITSLFDIRAYNKNAPILILQFKDHSKPPQASTMMPIGILILSIVGGLSLPLIAYLAGKDYSNKDKTSSNVDNL